MRYLFFCLCLLFIIIGCQTHQTQELYEYTPLAGFQNDTAAIQPGTKLRLLAMSGSMDNSKDIIYYSQVLVVNENNGDTLSVLCPAFKIPATDGSSNGLFIAPNQYDRNKNVTEATYLRSDSSVTNLLQIVAAESSGTNNDEHSPDISKYVNGNVTKAELVAINKSMPMFEHHYRTVIGILEFSTNVGI